MEVIPNKLAVFNLNTLYFFDNNAGVDGCAQPSEPGYEHMEWLRIQLQFMRERGMKAILMGHVPPARTDSKQLWDESCWQKYTLWLQQYRDVVVGGLYGHMNIDHFMLHDTKDINILGSLSSSDLDIRATMDDELDIMSASDYLEELRDHWAGLPNPTVLDTVDLHEDSGKSNKKGKKDKKKERKKKRQLKKMGGPWGERYHVTHVAPSIVPNYFPTIRVMEYNITGLDKSAVWANPKSWSRTTSQVEIVSEKTGTEIHPDEGSYGEITEDTSSDVFTDGNGKKRRKHKKKKKKKKKKPKKPKHPDFQVPSPPSKGTPPGPAYSPQPFTLTGYTQYFANLTHINNDYAPLSPDANNNTDTGDIVDGEKWREGKHKGKKPQDKPAQPRKFKYEVEYDTFTDKAYKLKDLTVKSYIKLAHRIGKDNAQKGRQMSDEPVDPDSEDQNKTKASTEGKDIDLAQNGSEKEYDRASLKHKPKKNGKNHKKKNHGKHKKNEVWLRFIRRAFVGTLEDDQLKNFGFTEKCLASDSQTDTLVRDPSEEVHDGEL